MDPVLLSDCGIPMRMLWALPLILLAGAGLIVRLRRRNDSDRLLTSEPVSGQWLAEARSREDQTW
jgi:cytochrome c-type biogenesis protein CcmH/NrfF